MLSHTVLRALDLRGIGWLIIMLRTVSPLSILKNPMIMIAGVGMILVFGMPYLMDNSKTTYPGFTSANTQTLWRATWHIRRALANPDLVDPEMKAEFEERQKSSPISGSGAGATNPLQNFDPAAWLAGSGTKTEEVNPVVEKGVTR